MGYTDSLLTDHLSTPLTTVSVPTEEMGARAGRLLADLLNGSEARAEEALPPELVVRSSTALRHTD